jgi:hypothetical protein
MPVSEVLQMADRRRADGDLAGAESLCREVLKA